MDRQVRTASGQPFPFAGVWDLQPELCTYQFGLVPASGTYTVELDPDNRVALRFEWSSGSGRSRDISFEGLLDGGRFPYFSTAVADELSFGFLPPDRLLSTAFKDGRRVHWAERSLDESGDQLTIVVYGYRADGSVYANTDVFRRRRS